MSMIYVPLIKSCMVLLSNRTVFLAMSSGALLSLIYVYLS